MQMMHTRWPIFGALVVGIVATAAMWYVVLSNPEGEAVPASGGRFVEGVTRPPERINPLFAAANPTDADLASLIFSGLVRLGPDGTPEPDLAERWEIAGNGTSYTFHLRRGVAWHDSPENELDADDVVFTFSAIADPEFRGDPALAALLDGVVVTARDPETVEFKLEQPYAPFLAHLTVGVLPEHLLRELDADALFNSTFNANPVGTGPYRFRGLSREGVVLESNPTYHFGPPFISRLDFRTFDDVSGLVQALRQGEIEGALFPPSASHADLDILRDDERFSLHELAATSMNIVYLDTRAAVFTDEAVRSALTRAINPQLLAGTLGSGGVPATNGIPPSSWAHTELEGPTFDPGAAARDLEIAGWSRGPDGIRQKLGVRLAFTLSTSNDPDRAALAEEVARQLRAVGASVVVQPLDASSYIDTTLLGRQFEAALAEIDYGPDPDPYPFWHSSQIAGTGRNLAAYNDPLIDDVLERARQTTDATRRTELYELFAGYFIAGAPSLPLYHPAWTYAIDADVRGFEEALLAQRGMRFSNVHEWYAHTRVK
jgi:peptide/nickel transport system substrate-binding protein